MATAPADKRRELLWRRIRHFVEIVVATTLVVIAALELRSMRETPQWMPFALLALALLIYSLRGRELTELAVGKDGLSWKVQRLEERTEAVEQKAEQTKEIVAQTAPKPSARRASAERKLKGGWDHPGLKRAKVKENDPQKGQWGGLAKRNGRELSAKVTRTDDSDWFSVSLEVRSTNADKPLTEPVRFHIHDTFNPDVIVEEPKNNVAKLHRYAVGAFTVGAEVKDEPETYLELDLADLEDAPRKFREN